MNTITTTVKSPWVYGTALAGAGVGIVYSMMKKNCMECNVKSALWGLAIGGAIGLLLNSMSKETTK